jgi:hypothetical protein
MVEENRQACAIEIEITPAMIEAGIEAYCLFDSDEPGEWIVDSIYRAMERAKRP